jgi:hypothetical protein
MALPEAVAELVPKAVRSMPATEDNWNALLECYGSEAAATEAVKRNLPVLLPYSYDGMKDQGADNIRGSYAVLQEMFGDEAEVLEVITKNPGVLGCKPNALSASTCDEIRRFAGVADVSEALLGPARRFLQSLPGWDEETELFLEVEAQKARLQAVRERAAEAGLEQLDFGNKEVRASPRALLPLTSACLCPPELQP